MLRRVDYGDADLIITFFTKGNGKTTAIAKSAKKSRKRFGGVLDHFSILQVVIDGGKGGRLPILKEATLEQPFYSIRTSIKKTAYASYWAELIQNWLQEDVDQAPLFELFRYILDQLDNDGAPEEVLSIFFQIRFAAIAGIFPNLVQCNGCNSPIEKIKSPVLTFDLERGCIICDKCKCSVSSKTMKLTKGLVKQLLWLGNNHPECVKRIRFSLQSLNEGLGFMETFMPYHLGKVPRSLYFLRRIRS